MIAGTLELPIEQLPNYAYKVGDQLRLSLLVRLVKIEEDSIDISSMAGAALASGSTNATMRVLEVRLSE